MQFNIFLILILTKKEIRVSVFYFRDFSKDNSLSFFMLGAGDFEAEVAVLRDYELLTALLLCVPHFDCVLPEFYVF